MLRLLQSITVAAACLALLGGCARNAYSVDRSPPPVDRSRPPLDQQTQLPVNRLWLGDRLQPGQVVYGELESTQNLPESGTFERIHKREGEVARGNVATPTKLETLASPLSTLSPDNVCRSQFCKELYGMFLFAIWPVLFVAIAPVIIPMALVEESKEKEAKAAAVLRESKDRETRAQAPTPEPAVPEGSTMPVATPVEVKPTQAALDVSSLPYDDAKRRSLEKHVQWLSSVATDEEFFSSWDQAYVSALVQALGWRAPLANSEVERHPPKKDGKTPDPPAGAHVRAGVATVALLDTKQGEHILVLCARSLVQRGYSTVRYFESCQRVNIELAVPYDSPAGSEAFRKVLVEQARKLAALQAKALTEQAKFIQVEW